ncbi:unnamed protein product [Adineta steineri]|uniref:Uncharacterized protein n=1 Tax=Adineta steineri TaxID=433720 RepID=A0A814ZPX0_9BILA|nr:unnamed protein product [Adineta steineri]CAF1502367.1 unnamed protein product [Adineta steineri]CAF4051242.1 unnamed protein product [Adineta steineri]CAF4124763.1 unnamed protein product [Adineta steineri]
MDRQQYSHESYEQRSYPSEPYEPKSHPRKPYPPEHYVHDPYEQRPRKPYPPESYVHDPHEQRPRKPYPPESYVQDPHEQRPRKPYLPESYVHDPHEQRPRKPYPPEPYVQDPYGSRPPPWKSYPPEHYVHQRYSQHGAPHLSIVAQARAVNDILPAYVPGVLGGLQLVLWLAIMSLEGGGLAYHPTLGTAYAAGAVIAISTGNSVYAGCIAKLPILKGLLACSVFMFLSSIAYISAYIAISIWLCTKGKTNTRDRRAAYDPGQDSVTIHGRQLDYPTGDYEYTDRSRDHHYKPNPDGHGSPPTSRLPYKPNPYVADEGHF